MAQMTRAILFGQSDSGKLARLALQQLQQPCRGRLAAWFGETDDGQAPTNSTWRNLSLQTMLSMLSSIYYVWWHAAKRLMRAEIDKDHEVGGDSAKRYRVQG
jgi:hypothetical protein